MNVTVAMLGVAAKVVAGEGDGCFVRMNHESAVLAPPALAVRRDGGEQPSPFTFDEFGSTHRLAWPRGGCTVRARADVVFWGNRWAAIVDLTSITVIDATANRQARIELSLLVPWCGCLAHAGWLWIGGQQRVSIIELAALEAVVAASERQLQVEFSTVFPLRDRGASTEARVAWVFDADEALVNIGTTQVKLYGRHGFEKGTTITLRDALYAGVYAAAELPDGTRVQLLEVEPPATVTTVRVVRGKTRDPAANSEPIASTDPRLEELLAELARDPDNDANRLVLVDLLQELGASFGTWVAEGGKRAQRREVLGPLAHYLEDVEYKGGLPWSAKLVRRPPTSGEHLVAAAGDLRLGMLSTLRIGKGPRSVYARLVGSPRALGLRRIDMNDREIALAVIAANRTQLTHLHDVRFTKAPLVKLLASPTFDRVVELETIVQRQHVDGLIARVQADEHGVFARAGRCLVVRERHGHDYQLFAPVLSRFMELPLVELQVGGLSVRRDGDRVTARVDSPLPISDWLDPLAAALPHLTAIEAPPHARLAVRERFPAITAA